MENTHTWDNTESNLNTDISMSLSEQHEFKLTVVKFKFLCTKVKTPF